MKTNRTKDTQHVTIWSRPNTNSSELPESHTYKVDDGVAPQLASGVQ